MKYLIRYYELIDGWYYMPDTTYTVDLWRYLEENTPDSVDILHGNGGHIRTNLIIKYITIEKKIIPIKLLGHQVNKNLLIIKFFENEDKFLEINYNINPKNNLLYDNIFGNINIDGKVSKFGFGVLPNENLYNISTIEYFFPSSILNKFLIDQNCFSK